MERKKRCPDLRVVNKAKKRAKTTAAWYLRTEFSAYASRWQNDIGESRAMQKQSSETPPGCIYTGSEGSVFI